MIIKPVRILALLVLASGMLGFNSLGIRWNISPEDPTIWVRFCEKPTVFDASGIPAGDPLSGPGSPDLSFDQVFQSTADDINNIPTSFLRIALYPSNPDAPGAPAAGDSEFTPERAAKRTIDVCFETLVGKGGEAIPRTDGKTIVGCEINLVNSARDSAANFVSILGHELGHCFGLNHPQETVHSLLSYHREDDLIRYQIDDRMGLTHLYPQESAYGEESPTLGMACSPSN